MRQLTSVSPSKHFIPKMLCLPQLTVSRIARCSTSIHLSLALVAIIRMVFLSMLSIPLLMLPMQA